MNRSIVFSGLLLSYLAVLSGFSPAKAATSYQSEWKLVRSEAPAELIEQVSSEFLSGLPIKVEPMKIHTISVEETKPIYLINTSPQKSTPRNNPLCVRAGCMYLMYVPTKGGNFQKVWHGYLDKNLPENVPLIQARDTFENGLPVLEVAQVQDGELVKFELKFDGNSYRITDTIVSSLPLNSGNRY